MNPITVDQEYTLIAGLHRLEAAKLLGWTEIECTVSSLEGLMAELAEIDENVIRKGLSTVEYNDLLLRRKEIYESLHPETKATYDGGEFRGNQHQKVVSENFSATTKSFVQDTADKLGVSPRTVELQIQTAKNLTPEAKKILCGSKITKQSALKLSRLPPEQQVDAARQLVKGKLHSADERRSTQTESAGEQTQEPSLPQTPTLPSLEIGYYPTVRDSAADLKNPDKDRSITSNTFLMSFSLFLQRFCQGVKSYEVNEFASVFPALTQEQLKQIQQEICSVHTALDNLFKIMERKSKK